MTRPDPSDPPVAPVRATSDQTRVGEAIRTPRAAAVAGIAFSVLFAVAVILVRTAVPPDPADAEQLLTDPAQRDAVTFALDLVPFAGIAFLWFVGVLRARFGEAEDRFFATAFLGSGLLFVAMLFVTAALAAGLVDNAGTHGSDLVDSGSWAVGQRVTEELMNLYTMRMAAVFTLAGSTILFRTGLAPRWLVLTGFLAGMLILVTVSFFHWIALAFPLWVLGVSVYILIAGLRRAPDRGPGARDASSSGRSAA
ncbi:MAG: hypothetical protein U0R70_13780 [Solirubrobacteraceae bacterium]